MSSKFMSCSSTKPFVQEKGGVRGEWLILKREQRWAISWLKHSVPGSVTRYWYGPNLVIQWWSIIWLAYLEEKRGAGIETSKWLKASMVTKIKKLLCEKGKIGPLVSMKIDFWNEWHFHEMVEKGKYYLVY